MAKTIKELYEIYAPCMASLTTENDDGETGIGAAFHIGNGAMLTARHVVEGRRIARIDPKDHRAVTTIHRVLYPSNEEIDLALLETDFSLKGRTVNDRPGWIPVGGHYDDWINDDAFVLSQVLLMGYPPIPTADRPVLVAVRGEINAVVDRYIGPRHPHFVTSPLPRGGFSGGPVISEWDFLLGVQTYSLTSQEQSPELGFGAAITVEPIWNLLAEHDLSLPYDING